jgi:hypothetical protein
MTPRSLRILMSKNEITNIDMAEILGCSKDYVSRLRMDPSKKYHAKITQAHIDKINEMKKEGLIK